MLRSDCHLKKRLGKLLLRSNKEYSFLPSKTITRKGPRKDIETETLKETEISRFQIVVT